MTNRVQGADLAHAVCCDEQRGWTGARFQVLELLSGPDVADAAPAFFLAFSPTLIVANPLAPAWFSVDAAPAFSPALDVANALLLLLFRPKRCCILVAA